MLFGRKKRRITRLLVVEDEPLIAFDNEHVLRDSGFEIVGTVDRAAPALRLLEGEAPDLVVTDVNLADGSGVEVARAARAQGVAVLFVTGNCPPDAREFAVGCLAKPYLPRDLLAAIDVVETVLDGGTPRKLPAGFSLFADAG